jgi:hypothetical protein
LKEKIMALLVGIDGTGPFFNSTYAREFANSFVNRIIRDSRTGGQDKRYYRGPIAPGGGLPEAINGGFDFIRQRRREGNANPILLTGYSRGAMGAVVIAKYLQDENIPVAALLMFDCVDRHARYDAEVIPNNVAKVLHIRRDARAGSRESFDNDGTQHNPPTAYEERFFVGTHGAMGGTPWVMPAGKRPSDLIDEGGIDGETNVTYAEDGRVSARVWSFCQPFLGDNGYT